MRYISFYLPQFHPIKENDLWWGEGFTEWRNVVKAKPRFANHNQPHTPADLGFYDLRSPEIRQRQISLANTYGVDAFCYYHYWFNGKRLLHEPLDDFLSNKNYNHSFCLCWANENWTRAWDGAEREILIAQDYTDDDWKQHIEWLGEVFCDSRYMRINDKPLFLIYRTGLIPDLREKISVWRDIYKKKYNGDLYLCSVNSNFNQISEDDLIKTGFDAVVDFQPSEKCYPPKHILKRLVRRTKEKINNVLRNLGVNERICFDASNRISYGEVMKNAVEMKQPDQYKQFPCVMPSWDNSARRSSPTIIQNNNAVLYGKWLASAHEKALMYPEEEQLVFINAWNEWAEGCHLEPDQCNGLKFLEKTLEIKKSYE